MYKILQTFSSLFLLSVLLHIASVNLFAQLEASTKIHTDKNSINKSWKFPLKKCWTYETDSMTSKNLASDNDSLIILPTSEKKIDIINSSNGNRTWDIKLNGLIDSELILENKQLIFVKSTEQSGKVKNYKGFLQKININSGINTLSAPLKLNRYDLGTLQIIELSKDNVYIIIGKTLGNIKAINSLTGNNIWEKELGVKITHTLISPNQNLLVGTENKTILEISKDTGKIITQTNSKTSPDSFLRTLDGKTFVGTKQGRLFLLKDKLTKKSWHIKLGGAIKDIYELKDNLLISSDDNYVYLVSKNKGKKIWKRKLSGRLIGKKILDKEGLGVFLSSGSNSVVFIDLFMGEIVNRIDVSSDMYFVSSPLFLKEQIIIPTQKGLVAYTYGSCQNKK